MQFAGIHAADIQAVDQAGRRGLDPGDTVDFGVGSRRQGQVQRHLGRDNGAIGAGIDHELIGAFAVDKHRGGDAVGGIAGGGQFGQGRVGIRRQRFVL